MRGQQGGRLEQGGRTSASMMSAWKRKSSAVGLRSCGSVVWSGGRRMEAKPPEDLGEGMYGPLSRRASTVAARHAERDNASAPPSLRLSYVSASTNLSAQCWTGPVLNQFDCATFYLFNVVPFYKRGFCRCIFPRPRSHSPSTNRPGEMVDGRWLSDVAEAGTWRRQPLPAFIAFQHSGSRFQTMDVHIHRRSKGSIEQIRLQRVPSGVTNYHTVAKTTGIEVKHRVYVREGTAGCAAPEGVNAISGGKVNVEVMFGNEENLGWWPTSAIISDDSLIGLTGALWQRSMNCPSVEKGLTSRKVYFSVEWIVRTAIRSSPFCTFIRQPTSQCWRVMAALPSTFPGVGPM
ncbi:hypothetical protein DFH09DRAFT_1503377 [Mycena vulgaris]|nr:hypothetical protein DFH09DRAFT_1503377 [Mycena vulgaris]